MAGKAFTSLKMEMTVGTDRIRASFYNLFSMMRSRHATL